MADLAVGGAVAGAAAWLLTYLLHSTVVVGAVWLLVRTGWVRSPTTQDLLWKVALTAALVTASVAVFAPARVERTLDVEVARAGSGGGPAWQGGGPEGREETRIRVRAVAPTPVCRVALGRLREDPLGDASAVRRACGPVGGPGWRGLLVALWLLGSTGLVAQTLLSRRELRRRLVEATPADRSVRDTARGLLPFAGRPLKVVVARGFDTPCVVGGRIVLPLRCVGALTPEQMRAVLAHEVAHLVRRDPTWITVGEVLCRALWMQPLNRLALEGMRGSAELVCDDWAVERTRRPLELASSIARVAEWIHPGRRSPALAHLAQLAHMAPGEGRTLSARVRRILAPGAVRRAAPRPLRLLLAALVVAPTLAVPAVPRATEVYAILIRREAGQEGARSVRRVHFDDAVVLAERARPSDS